MPALIPEGTYEVELIELSAEHSRASQTPYLKLLFQLKDPTFNGERIMVYIVGSWDNLIAWRTLVGRTFRVKVEHKLHEDRTYIDSRVKELLP